MRRGPVVLVALAVALAFPALANAAPVLVLGHHGRAAVRNDPFLTGPAVTPTPPATSPPSPPAPGAPRSAPGFSAQLQRARGSGPTSGTGPGAPTAATPRPPAHRRRRKLRPQITVLSELARLQRQGSITSSAYQGYAAAFNAALGTERHLHGTRRSELSAITETMHQLAAGHQLTASRLPALFATLAANRQWWTQGPLLAPHQRVEFAGSQLVWEYYPGQGLQLQVLGSFGKADGLYTGGPADYPALQQLLSELIPLAARRGGGLTWEYYFSFDGGSPPWTSAMSQATGLEALGRAYQATGNRYYLDVGDAALPVLTLPPPSGVDVRTPLGSRFLQYTFAPSTAILNAFLQTLIGLDAFAQASGNQTAAQLFSAGNAEALAEVPRYDTGAWSLYQPGIEDDLSYHELVTGFLAQLCTLTGAPTYCTTAQRFNGYLTTPPALQQLTVRARTRRPLALRFQLSKVSHVGLVVTRGAQTVYATSAGFPYGVDRFTVPALKRPGTYSVTLAATDLAGNFTRIAGSLQLRR